MKFTFFMIFVFQKGFANPITVHQIRERELEFAYFQAQMYISYYICHAKKL